jgi:hypothetical protein
VRVSGFDALALDQRATIGEVMRLAKPHTTSDLLAALGQEIAAA